MIHLNDLSNAVDITVCSCKQSPFCGSVLSKACYFTREHVKQQDCATLQADNNLISASQGENLWKWLMSVEALRWNVDFYHLVLWNSKTDLLLSCVKKIGLCLIVLLK